jgi:hypothetical protein
MFTIHPTLAVILQQVEREIVRHETVTGRRTGRRRLVRR